MAEKNLYRGVFFNKWSGRASAILQIVSNIVGFLKILENFRNTYFGNVCERLLFKVRSLTVSFRKVSERTK